MCETDQGVQVLPKDAFTTFLFFKIENNNISVLIMFFYFNIHNFFELHRL